MSSHTTQQKKRIGFFISELKGIPLEVFQGVEQEAQRLGYDLFTYSGDVIHDAEGNIPDESRVFDLADPEQLHGLIVFGGSLAQFCTPVELQSFLGRFRGKPIVSTAMAIPPDLGYTLHIDNYAGIHQLALYLIDQLGYRDFAFIKGPEGHGEAEERFQAFKDALSARGIDPASALVLPGDFSPEAGKAAVQPLLNAKPRPRAVMCVDDDTALGLLEGLAKGGISVPDQMAVTGFDNIEEAGATVPPLTTVRQPIKEQGVMAVQVLHRVFQGESQEATISVPTQMVIRRSCGSVDQSIASVSGPLSDAGEGVQGSSSFEEQLIAGLPDEVPQAAVTIARQFSSMVQEVQKSFDPSRVYGALEKLFLEMIAKDLGFSWFSMILDRVRIVLAHGDEALSPPIESFLHQARTQLFKASHRRDTQERLHQERFFGQINQEVQQLNTALNIDHLSEIFPQSMARLDVPTAALALYQKPYEITKGARLIAAVREGTSLGQGGAERALAGRELLPSLIAPGARAVSYIITTLSFSGEQFGFLGVEVPRGRGDLAATLRFQLSGIIKRIFMVQSLEEGEKQLSERASALESRVQPILEIIKTIQQETSDKLTEVRQLSDQVVESAKAMEKTAVAYDEIGGMVASMVRTMGVIDDISENVNVLAINAAIQSAHAGEYGKGFSVIANEIRKLSGSTAQNSREITESLNEATSRIRGATESSRANLESYQSVHQRLEGVVELVTSIAGQMDDLSRRSQEILQVMFTNQ